MTSSVKASAHCADEKEVVVRVINMSTNEQLEEYVLQNGEVKEVYVWDDRAVITHERLKDMPVAGE